MRLSILFSTAFLFCFVSLAGCGGSNKATAPGADELAQYADENAAQMAEQEKIDDMEDAEEEDDE